MATDKNPGLAAGLSIIWAGLGEIYAGNPIRGIPFVIAELYLATIIYGDLFVVPPRINSTAWLFAGVVTISSVVNAYFCAKSYNARHFLVCPRCGGKNAKGAPQCLLCWAPLSAGGAPPGHGPPPPPPRGP